MIPTLDLTAVRAFVLTADLMSFTRAADRLGTSQAAVSMKLRRLEAQLKKRLLERTPRYVRLSADGTAFLPAARHLLQAHDSAMAATDAERRRLSIGISQHLVGSRLPTLLVQLHRTDPNLVVDLCVAGSGEVIRQWQADELDAAIVVQEPRSKDGKLLYNERFSWMGVPHWPSEPSKALPLSTQGKSCSLRNAAVTALDRARIAWTETFIGQGAACVGAAAAAGLAIGVLSVRAAPAETVDLAQRLNLPALPRRRVVLHSSLRDRRSKEALDIVAVALSQQRAA